VKRTAETNQRLLRCSSGCAHLELLDTPRGIDDSLAVRPAYLTNRFASRGSAAV
jgi:hypothetical protein